jgi:hypothetical protein
MILEETNPVLIKSALVEQPTLHGTGTSDSTDLIDAASSRRKTIFDGSPRRNGPADR